MKSITIEERKEGDGEFFVSVPTQFVGKLRNAGLIVIQQAGPYSCATAVAIRNVMNFVVGTSAGSPSTEDVEDVAKLLPMGSSMTLERMGHLAESLRLRLRGFEYTTHDDRLVIKRIQ